MHGERTATSNEFDSEESPAETQTLVDNESGHAPGQLSPDGKFSEWKRYSGGRSACPITGYRRDTSLTLMLHGFWKQSIPETISVSREARRLHFQNYSAFFRGIDNVMRFPFASIPVIGGHLYLLVVVYAAIAFPFICLIDLMRMRHPLEEGLFRLQEDGIWYRVPADRIERDGEDG